MPYLMTLTNRRKKRNIYLRAARLLGDLNDTLREIKEMAGDLTADYEVAQAPKPEREAQEIVAALGMVDLRIGGVRGREKLADVLAKFNNLPEELQ